MRTTVAALLMTSLSGCAATPPAAANPAHGATPITPSTTAKMRACPDGWFDNQMPGPDAPQAPATEYMIYGGERVELATVDVDWVKQHCPITSASRVE